MNKIFIALLIGAAAGVIDALPMLRQKNIPRFSVVATFFQWVFLGLVIPFVRWDIDPWLTGLILGELGMLPFMILVMYRNKKAVMPMIVFAAILGIAIGVAGDYFIRPEPLFNLDFSGS